MGWMNADRVSERAKLSSGCWHFGPAPGVLAACLAAAGCGGSGAMTPNYDTTTGRLVRLDVDAAADGRIEQRTYLDGNIPFRSETDRDGNGRVDRWEYVDMRGTPIKVGSSSRDDGIEDCWVYAAEQDGERLVERSTERTARVDRREFF